VAEYKTGIVKTQWNFLQVDRVYFGSAARLDMAVAKSPKAAEPLERVGGEYPLLSAESQDLSFDHITASNTNFQANRGIMKPQKGAMTCQR
jgi:hypothetical protein